jgi:hypothetical protein
MLGLFAFLPTLKGRFSPFGAALGAFQERTHRRTPLRWLSARLKLWQRLSTNLAPLPPPLLAYLRLARHFACNSFFG